MIRSVDYDIVIEAGKCPCSVCDASQQQFFLRQLPLGKFLEEIEINQNALEVVVSY